MIESSMIQQMVEITRISHGFRPGCTPTNEFSSGGNVSSLTALDRSSSFNASESNSKHYGAGGARLPCSRLLEQWLQK